MANYQESRILIDAVSVSGGATVESGFVNARIFDFVSLTAKNDADTSYQVTIEYSEDGVTVDGAEQVINSSIALSSVATRVKAPFVNVKATNSDGTVTHVITVKGYLTDS